MTLLNCLLVKIKITTIMKLLSSLTLGLLAFGVNAFRHEKCPPFKGNMTVNQYQLYPENADWDTKNCILYFGYSFSTDS